MTRQFPSSQRSRRGGEYVRRIVVIARSTILFISAAILIGLQIPAITAQQAVKSANPATDWPMFGHDLAATRYSPLKQINAGNVAKLKLAWRMPYRADRSGAVAGGLGALSEATPVVVNG